MLRPAVYQQQLFEHIDRMIPHSGRAHSIVGPSSAHRVQHCPGSVRASEGVESKSSFWALEGTAAHEFCEHIVRTGLNPGLFEGGRVVLNGKTPKEKFHRPGYNLPDIDRENVFEIDEEMIAGAALYRDTLEKYTEPGSILELEMRLDISHVHPLCFGTSDASIMTPWRKRVVITDYKYGRGIAVEVDENWQLLLYGLGVLRMLREFEIDEVVLVVVQPRAYHPVSDVRSKTYTLAEMELFEHEIRVALARIDDEDADFEAGDHCRFCPIAFKCPTLRNLVHELLGIKRGKSLMTLRNKSIADMSPDELGELVRGIPVIEIFLHRVQDHANAKARSGKMPTGMKYVYSKTSRRISNPTGLEMVLNLEGYDQDDFMTGRKLRGIGALESLLGKAGFAELAEGYLTRTDAKLILVPVEDRRKAVDINEEGNEFGSVDD